MFQFKNLIDHIAHILDTHADPAELPVWVYYEGTDNCYQSSVAYYDPSSQAFIITAGVSVDRHDLIHDINKLIDHLNNELSPDETIIYGPNGLEIGKLTRPFKTIAEADAEARAAEKSFGHMPISEFETYKKQVYDRLENLARKREAAEKGRAIEDEERKTTVEQRKRDTSW